ncbi:MAG TPA: hypothetical protein VIO56_02940 [Methylotenera sp.]|jgi:hypothetical protein
MKIFFTACSFLCTVFYSLSAQAVSEISISAERVEHPQADIQQLAIKLNLKKTDTKINIKSAIKQKAEKAWMQFSLNCELPLKSAPFQCADGLLKSERLNIPFGIEFSHLYSQNKLDVDATLQFKNASFSDEAGLHAADKLNGSLAISLKPSAEAWLWRTSVDWRSGEVFWQPFYIPDGGHQLTASGKLESELLTFNNAHLKVKDVGELNASGQLSLNNFKILNLSANLPNLNLSAAYPMFFKPLLEKTAFAHAEINGVAVLKLEIENAEPKLFELLLKDVDIADKNEKFAFYKVNANIPWDYDAAKTVSFGYESGALLNLPLGKTNIQAQVDRYSLTAPSIKLPILDGALHLTNISAARKADQWYWHLGARLDAISMEDFSTHLKLPTMHGKASAEIPLVTYAAGGLTTDGSVVLNVFDGTATVTELTMQSPLGITPKLNANIALRHLDLGVLTSTFSFGAIEGKLDGDIKNLELQNWKPVKFDAIVQSSPGKYPKKISQRAVENISALGGGGAAAAVQRSFLRFFEQFNYGKMGLSCRLRNDICEMGGIESTPQGYIIVKGSGIPAITVMGYNKTVGWSELLSRIKRVTDGNTKAVVQ